ncbi:unnamed protein product, partial [Amoebophrya sp. A120]
EPVSKPHFLDNVELESGTTGKKLKLHNSTLFQIAYNTDSSTLKTPVDVIEVAIKHP